MPLTHTFPTTLDAVGSRGGFTQYNALFKTNHELESLVGVRYASVDVWDSTSDSSPTRYTSPSLTATPTPSGTALVWNGSEYVYFWNSPSDSPSRNILYYATVESLSELSSIVTGTIIASGLVSLSFSYAVWDNNQYVIGATQPTSETYIVPSDFSSASTITLGGGISRPTATWDGTQYIYAQGSNSGLVTFYAVEDLSVTNPTLVEIGQITLTDDNGTTSQLEGLAWDFDNDNFIAMSRRSWYVIETGAEVPDTSSDWSDACEVIGFNLSSEWSDACQADGLGTISSLWSDACQANDAIIVSSIWSDACQAYNDIENLGPLVSKGSLPTSVGAIRSITWDGTQYVVINSDEEIYVFTDLDNLSIVGSRGTIATSRDLRGSTWNGTEYAVIAGTTTPRTNGVYTFDNLDVPTTEYFAGRADSVGHVYIDITWIDTYSLYAESNIELNNSLSEIHLFDTSFSSTAGGIGIGGFNVNGLPRSESIGDSLRGIVWDGRKLVAVTTDNWIVTLDVGLNEFQRPYLLNPTYIKTLTLEGNGRLIGITWNGTQYVLLDNLNGIYTLDQAIISSSWSDVCQAVVRTSSIWSDGCIASNISSFIDPRSSSAWSGACQAIEIPGVTPPDPIVFVPPDFGSSSIPVYVEEFNIYPRVVFTIPLPDAFFQEGNTWIGTGVTSPGGTTPVGPTVPDGETWAITSFGLSGRGTVGIYNANSNLEILFSDITRLPLYTASGL